MSTDDSPKKPAARSWRWIVIAFALLLLAFGGKIGFEHARDADEIAQLRRYTPHGSHYIDTALTGGPVNWRSREIRIWKVQKKTRLYSSVEEFKDAFQQRSPHPEASISVHHPALNLEKEEGRQSHDRAEEILTFLAENGYENAGVVAN